LKGSNYIESELGDTTVGTQYKRIKLQWGASRKECGKTHILKIFSRWLVMTEITRIDLEYTLS
jgi:uncharacterized protein YwlG (UPF0340 family)